METLCKGYANTAESLMVSGLCFDAILDCDRSALTLPSRFGDSVVTYTNWFGEGANDESGELERDGGHACAVASSEERRRLLGRTEAFFSTKPIAHNANNIQHRRTVYSTKILVASNKPDCVMSSCILRCGLIGPDVAYITAGPKALGAETLMRCCANNHKLPF